MFEFAVGHQLMMRDLHERGIKNTRVLKALDAVPRHRFVPEALRAHSYNLRPLPIGWGQTISTPFIVASMSSLLQLKGTERVLEIGTGCGYQTAVLCELSAEVFSIEIVDSVAAFGRENLTALGYTPHLRVGDGTVGWPSAAPFDVALIAATAPTVPIEIVQQLKVGGVLVAPLEQSGREVLVRITRTKKDYVVEELYDVRFVPMTGSIRS